MNYHKWYPPSDREAPDPEKKRLSGDGYITLDLANPLQDA